ncbi:hypothetical protein BsWGS_12665 [Bradybaena similaris]
MSSQTLPLNYSKPEPDEEESKIDLFMEALTVHTIDKVQSELSELQKENQNLRRENAELNQSKKQLSKNISSLFLTARAEIQKKEEEISKLVARLEREQEKLESYRLKQVQHDLQHPSDTISASVNSRSTVCSKKDQQVQHDLQHPSDTISASVNSRSTVCSKKDQQVQHDLQHPSDTISASVNSRSTVCSKKDQQVQHDLQHPSDTISASVNSRSTVCSKKDQHSEIRNKLMKEISQSYSLSSCQGVASRKKQKGDVFDIQTVQKNSNNTISEPGTRKPMIDELKSCEDGKVAGSKQDSVIKNHYSTKYFSSTSDCQRSHVSTFVLRTSKECLKNKRTAADVEIQRLVKIQKINTPKINFIKNSAERTEKSTKHTEKRCSNEHENHLPLSESKIASIDFNSSSLNNSDSTVTGHPTRKPKHFMFVATSEHEKTETLGNDSAKSSKEYSVHHANKNCLVQLHKPQIHKLGTSLGLISSVDTDAGSAEIFDGKVNANNFQTENLKCNLKSDCSLAPVKSSLLVKTSRECTSNVKSTPLPIDSSHIAISTHNQAFLNGNDTASCRNHKTAMVADHDKNSNCSSNESALSQGTACVENGQNNSSDEFSIDSVEPTYITCTSNLILLGDEETTCTTIISPCKLQPSELYPPGVRGDVHEGGSHARHIRGITQVIKKVPIDKYHYFHSEPSIAELPYITDDKIPEKAWNDTSDESYSKNVCTSDTLNCYKTHKSEIIHKKSMSDKIKASIIDKYPKTDLYSHFCDNLEEIRSGKAENINVSQNCHKPDDWASTVNDTFGTIFHKKLCTLKQGPAHPVVKNPRSAQERIGYVNQKMVSGISTSLQEILTKEDKREKYYLM